MRLSASSTARNSVVSRRPADRPRRCGSTTVVCSTRTRVSRLSTTIVGRKLADRAPVEVGAASVVLRSRNSSACTMTAKRAPRCSCPRGLRRGGKRKISPRTTNRQTAVRAPPSARESNASPRGQLRQQRGAVPLRGSRIGRGVARRPPEEQCVPPLNPSCHRHGRCQARRRRCRPAGYEGNAPRPQRSTDRATDGIASRDLNVVHGSTHESTQVVRYRDYFDRQTMTEQLG
jgi:hypothetical protein